MKLSCQVSHVSLVLLSFSVIVYRYLHFVVATLLAKQPKVVKVAALVILVAAWLLFCCTSCNTICLPSVFTKLPNNSYHLIMAIIDHLC